MFVGKNYLESIYNYKNSDFNNISFSQGRIQSNVVGGVPELLGGASSTARSAVEQVRPRQREALAEGAAAGSGGAKIGLLES